MDFLAPGSKTLVEQNLLEAQVSVLGSLIISPEIAGELISEVRAEDFTQPTYRKIYDACRELYFARTPIDPVAICNAIGMEYSGTLLEIMQVTPTAAYWHLYADIMREQAALSRISSLAFELANSLSIDDATTIMDKLNQQVSGRQSAKIVPLTQGITDFFARHDGKKAPQYLRWGLPALNKMLCAEPGDFVLIGGYPSTGKTVLAVQAGWEQARMQGKRVGIFSLETSDSRLYDRLICMAAKIPYEEIKRNTLRPESWAQAAEVGVLSDTVHLDVIRASGMTVSEIRAISLYRHYDIIYIDYVQLISSDVRFRGGRVEAMTEVSIALHTFAQTSGITVIGLSQLTRPDKLSKGSAPTMSSLRESGQFEQDADIVMLLYLADESVPDGDRRLKIAKNKEGERGFVTLGFDPLKMLMYQHSSRQDEPPVRSASRFTEMSPRDMQQSVFDEERGGPPQ